MKNSPLQLEQYCVTAVHLDANPEAPVKDQVQWSISTKSDLATHRDDPRRWKVDLTVSFHSVDEANSPYTGTVSFVGFFAVEKTYPEEKVRMLVETNAPSVLFGSAREMVANLTARGPWPMVMLPTQSFYKSPDKSAPSAPAAKPATPN
jgi:preprotein translocase subunit SecB